MRIGSERFSRPAPTCATHFSSAAWVGVSDDTGLFDVVKPGQELSHAGRSAPESMTTSFSGSAVPDPST